jgi:hypothetical protein
VNHLQGRVARLEAAHRFRDGEPDSCERAELAGELRPLLAAVPHEYDQAALLRRMDAGSANSADRARLTGCTLGTLRAVVALCARI